MTLFLTLAHSFYGFLPLLSFVFTFLSSPPVLSLTLSPFIFLPAWIYHDVHIILTLSILYKKIKINVHFYWSPSGNVFSAFDPSVVIQWAAVNFAHAVRGQHDAVIDSEGDHCIADVHENGILVIACNDADFSHNELEQNGVEHWWSFPFSHCNEKCLS